MLTGAVVATRCVLAGVSVIFICETLGTLLLLGAAASSVAWRFTAVFSRLKSFFVWDVMFVELRRGAGGQALSCNVRTNDVCIPAKKTLFARAYQKLTCA